MIIDHVDVMDLNHMIRLNESHLTSLKELINQHYC